MRKRGTTDKQYIKILQNKIDILIQRGVRDRLVIDQILAGKDVVPLQIHEELLKEYERMRELLIQYNLYTG